MGRLLLPTLAKFIMYCKSVDVKSNCLCSPDQVVMTVFNFAFPDEQLSNFSTTGRFLVCKPDIHLLEKVDVKRVATEIQENDDPVTRINLPIWRPCMRFVNAIFLRHLYSKCDFCSYFTSDIEALGNRCPHCRHANWPSPGLYIAQTRGPEQPMHSVWYRASPTSYLVTDHLESHPLPQYKEMCHTSDFLSKQRKFPVVEEYEKTHDSLRIDELMESLHSRLTIKGDLGSTHHTGVEEAWEVGRSDLTS